jgi:hypothetical protein
MDIDTPEMEPPRVPNGNRGGGDTDDAMNRIFIALVLSGAIVAPVMASAATVTNRDDTAHTLTVSEGGYQAELVVGPGETMEFCPSGCFVTMPNGDREALTGAETLEIKAGRGKIY